MVVVSIEPTIIVLCWGVSFSGAPLCISFQKKYLLIHYGLKCFKVNQELPLKQGFIKKTFG